MICLILEMKLSVAKINLAHKIINLAILDLLY
jgi:hypothetical protein